MRKRPGRRQTCYASDAQRLGPEDGKYERRHERGEEDLGYAILPRNHGQVQRKCDSGKDAGDITKLKEASQRERADKADFRGVPSRKLGGKKKENSLGKEDKGSRRDHSIIPRIHPIAPIPWGAGTNVPQDSRTDVDRGPRS
jgi:hypothetical protein